MYFINLYRTTGVTVYKTAYGGKNGGGSALGRTGAGGGGSTDIRTGVGLSTRIAIAGGGGGD
jgi:hypothetical protein